MLDTLEFILSLIRLDLLFGFGFYSTAYFILKYLLKDPKWLLDFDRSALRLMTYLGLVWLALWIVYHVAFYYNLDFKEQLAFKDRLRGKYSFGIWLQPLFWGLISQLYRFEFFAKYLLNRWLISLLFFLSFERLVIIGTSLHRDYLADTWDFIEIGLSPLLLLGGSFGRILLVSLVVSVYHYGWKRIRRE